MENTYYIDRSGERKENGQIRLPDDGLNGKNFEVNVRFALQGKLLRKTTITKNDGRGYDIKRRDGTRIEVKSGCGVLAYQMYSMDDYSSTTELPPIDISALLAKADYIVYTPKPEELVSVLEARVFTRDEFLDMLESIGLLRYKGDSNAEWYNVTIQTYSNSKRKLGMVEMYLDSMPTLGEWLEK